MVPVISLSIFLSKTFAKQSRAFATYRSLLVKYEQKIFHSTYENNTHLNYIAWSGRRWETREILGAEKGTRETMKNKSQAGALEIGRPI